MPKATCLSFVLALAFPVVSLPAGADEASLRQCQGWKKQIDRLTEQRRAGGRARQMEQWKRRRQDYRERFIEGGCRKYGRSLQ